MPYSKNQNSCDESSMKKIENKNSFNLSRSIPRGPYLQYKYNERQLKNLNHSQISTNFNRNLEGKLEYVSQDTTTLIKQEKRSHIDKENENFIENKSIHATKMGTYNLRRPRKNTGELKCCEILRQDENNFEPSNMRGGVCIDRTRNKDEPNFIYLKDVIKTKAGELTESDGWSLLCQSVQALQDLFISNITLSSSQILPVITPDTVRISSRGRVAFDILTSKLLSSYLCFLSPEYLNNIERRYEFLESDIEKIWIYSLGITLQRALLTYQIKKNQADIKQGDSLSLERIIRSMCVPNIRFRSSLMYLLDMISQYCCRNASLDKRPFSHVAMDLFREVIGKLETEENELCASKHSDQIPQAADCLRVKKYSSATRQKSKVTDQNVRFEYLLRKELCNRNKIPYEPLSLNTMHKLTSLPDLNKYETLPRLAPLNIRKVPKKRQKDFKKDNRPNIKPGFITDSSQYKEINLLPVELCRCKINVISLSGFNYKIRCDATMKISQILENILTDEQLEENFFLGICALIGGDFVFLPSKMKVIKIYERINSTDALVSKTFKKGDITTITLYLRVKFYLSNLKEMSTTSHHLIYLQLRKSILEQQIMCTMQDMIVLGGLALQAEIGDYQPMMESREYFTTSYYLPESLYPQKNKEFSKYLRNAHFCRRGLHPQDAEFQFIQYVQRMDEYGKHLYSAILETKIQHNVYIGISLTGISIFNRPTPRINVDNTYRTDQHNSLTSHLRKPNFNFNWIEIENLSYSKHIFSLIVKQQPNDKMMKDGNRNKYRFKMCGKKSFFAFSLASEHHQLHIRLKESSINIDKNKINIPNIPLKVNADLYNNRNNDGNFLSKLWYRPKSSNDLMRSAKESNFQTTTENFQNESCEHPEHDEYNNLNSSFNLLNTNRNRVKMGTRVYSSINRSYNEINNLYECYRSYIPNKTNYMKNQTSSTDPSNFKRNRAFSQCLSVTKYKPDDELTSQQSSISKFFNLDSYGVTSNLNEAYVIDSSFGSATDIGLFPSQNESVSVTLLDKFINMASTSNNFNDRIITRIAIIKDSSFDQNIQNERKQSAINSMETQKNRYLDRSKEQFSGVKKIEQRVSLGISIVQGSDKNIYVKDLVEDSPAERHGITVGDQLLAVNGVSILNLTYQEVVDLLRNTGRIVELTVSQLYQNFENKLKLKSMEYIKMKDSIQGINNNKFDSLKSTRSLPNLSNVNE